MSPAGEYAQTFVRLDSWPHTSFASSRLRAKAACTTVDGAL